MTSMRKGAKPGNVKNLAFLRPIVPMSGTESISTNRFGVPSGYVGNC